MHSRAAWILVVALALAMTGCAKDTVPGRFVRYEKATNGETYAIVALVGEQEGSIVRAYCRRSDLKENEAVRVEFTGRSWDVPQQQPDWEVK